MNPLETLADYLDTNLPDGIQVYGYAADTVKAPAVVIVPGSPFNIPYTQGGPNSVAWGLELKIVVSRSQPKYGLRMLYDMRREITDLLEGAPEPARWLAFDSIETTQVGGADLLQGTLTVVIVAQEA